MPFSSKVAFRVKFANIASSLLLVGTAHAKQHGFLKDTGNGTWGIGNDVWNMTQEHIYGSKLYYKGTDLVGQAAGHYVSYNGVASNLNWTSATVSRMRSHSRVASEIPAYSDAALNTNARPVYNFVPASLISSKLLVRSNNVDRYCFVTDHGSNSKVWIHAGASKSNKALGCLSFPEAHNTFRIHCAMVNHGGDAGESIIGLDDKNFLSAPLVDVVAGIGYPHPKTFALKIPRGLDFRSKELVWTYREGDITGPTPARYDLRDRNTGDALIASLTTTKEGKKRTAVQWFVHPESELEQAVLIMSCIGIVTRLSRKAKFYDEKWMYSKWRFFWWMTTLSAVAIA
ncbi:hypothetical protein QM012_009196 [Aureobasidium pullulans]|uniref:Uncharacterized protein n=1 Tax=Aureobasidium pullulans TaxID=5580 RepID=A0ABR0THM5_AURPU